MSTIFTKSFNAPSIDKGEILRYAGSRENLPETDALISSCLSECENILTYKVCYVILPVSFQEKTTDLTFMQTQSQSLFQNLSWCHSFVLFAATVGIELDRLIAKYGRISPSRALMLQAIGAERIESLCNAFNNSISQEYGCTKPRFSPGYGDLPIDVQKDFFRVLEPSRKIGLTLNESMLMTPSKSVTAIIGITASLEKSQEHNCSQCTKTDCSFRRKL